MWLRNMVNDSGAALRFPSGMFLNKKYFFSIGNDFIIFEGSRHAKPADTGWCRRVLRSLIRRGGPTGV